MDWTYLRKLKDKFNLWHLMYRTEIIIFIIGFIVGAIIFVMEFSSIPWALEALSDSRMKSIFEFTVEFIEQVRTAGTPFSGI